MDKFSRNRRDVYYRKAKEDGWRARSAFKLIELDQKYHILDGITKAVDLCAAPGSWSQVLSRKLYLDENIDIRCPLKLFYTEQDDYVGEHSTSVENEPQGENTQYSGPHDNVKIVAVDLQDMVELPGVTLIQGDITEISTAEKIMEQFEGDKAELVICDGAPDVTGLHAIDTYTQCQLLLGAIHIMCNVLKVGGNFVAKIFRDRDCDLLSNQLFVLFKDVEIWKPGSSRVSSIEAFVVCRDYQPLVGFDPRLITQFLDVSNRDFSKLEGVNRIVIPLLVCGDVSGYDQIGPKSHSLVEDAASKRRDLSDDSDLMLENPTDDLDSVRKTLQLRWQKDLEKLENCPQSTHVDEIEVDDPYLDEELNYQYEPECSKLSRLCGCEGLSAQVDDLRDRSERDVSDDERDWQLEQDERDRQVEQDERDRQLEEDERDPQLEEDQRDRQLEQDERDRQLEQDERDRQLEEDERDWQLEEGECWNPKLPQSENRYGNFCNCCAPNLH